MKKPVNLRTKTWQWIQTTLKNQPQSVIEEAIDKPGQWLLDHGLLDRPEILQNTAIEQNPEDGPECLIDELAAVALSMGMPEITVFRLGDHKAVVMTREEVIDSLKNGHIFDQLG